MMRLLAIVLVAALAAASPARAQLADPAAVGVAMGHVHLLVKDVEFYQKVFTSLGGVPVRNGPLEMLQFPGVFLLARQGEPTAGSDGSSVNHIGFLVQDLSANTAKWRAAGFTFEERTVAGLAVANLTGPDGVRIEVVEDKTISQPIEFQHVHFSAVDPEGMRDWYVKMFGFTPNLRRGTIVDAILPGGHVSFAKSDKPVEGTRGRALDHIGFEVRNLEAFVKRLEANGAKMDMPYTMLPNSSLSIAFLTDPWGTYIELTENLALSR